LSVKTNSNIQKSIAGKKQENGHKI